MAFLAALPAIVAAAATVYGQIQKQQAEEEQAGAAQRQMEAQRRAAAQLQAFAPIDKQARLNSMQSQLGAYGPLNAWMGATYGPGAKQNLQVQDPFKGTGWQGA